MRAFWDTAFIFEMLVNGKVLQEEESAPLDFKPDPRDQKDDQLRRRHALCYVKVSEFNVFELVFKNEAQSTCFVRICYDGNVVTEKVLAADQELQASDYAKRPQSGGFEPNGTLFIDSDNRSAGIANAKIWNRNDVPSKNNPPDLTLEIRYYT